MKTILAMLMGLSLLSASATAQELATYVIRGGPVYTADDTNPRAEAVAVSGDRIIYAGDEAGLSAFIGPETQEINLNGAALYPGFTDAHAHLNGIGMRQMMLNLEDVTSITDLQEKLLAWRAAHPGEDVITGRGWIETHWPEGRFPSRFDLDAAINDIPVILYRADGHAAVVNTQALHRADITGTTTIPSGGDILKNAIGEPTGMLIDTAQSLVDGLMPAITPNTLSQALRTGSSVYASLGWTGLHNMSVGWQESRLIESLADADQIPIRVYNSVSGEESSPLIDGGPRVQIAMVVSSPARSSCIWTVRLAHAVRRCLHPTAMQLPAVCC